MLRGVEPGGQVLPDPRRRRCVGLWSHCGRALRGNPCDRAPARDMRGALEQRDGIVGHVRVGTLGPRVVGPIPTGPTSTSPCDMRSVAPDAA